MIRGKPPGKGLVARQEHDKEYHTEIYRRTKVKKDIAETAGVGCTALLAAEEINYQKYDRWHAGCVYI